MNPPTIGHGKLLDKLAAVAGKNPYRIFLSQSNDQKKNPLKYADKIKYVRKMFPKHARSVMINKKVITPFHALSALYDEGFRKVIMVAGDDRVPEYEIRLNKYNGVKSNHGFYNFESGIKVVSAGQRDPDAEGATGASGTKQRKYATDNDFTSFAQSLPKEMRNADARRLFNDVRKGLGLKEEKEFKNHVQLDKVSALREAFVSGEVLNEGDKVVLKGTDIIVEVCYRGSNYIIVESTNGQRYRKWIDDVELIEEDNKKSMYKDKPDWGTPESTKKAKKMTPGENLKEDDEREKESPQDPDIKDRPGTQPKAYHKGLSKTTKIARDRHFKKKSKMDDDNPAAYKPAPGDKTAKTKPSKHTKKFKQMFGEAEKQTTASDLAKQKIDREKKADALKHDRMMDRARMLDTKKKNRETDA
jgi:hypothetical protein